MAERGFSVIGEEQPAPPQAQQEQFAVKLLWQAITALSQRALVAIASLFTLVTVASVFWLFLSQPEPTVLHLVQAGMYAVFVLAVNLIVRRK